MKPENILLDKDGYPVITDFGLSKEQLVSGETTDSFCGTAEYMAPEIIQRIEYGNSVDWWSFGAIIYEMLVGYPPYCGSNKKEIYHRIVSKLIT